MIAEMARWKPLLAPRQNGAHLRSPQALRAVVAQFQVETNPRYQPENGHTFCNIFVWDVMLALRCELPHWVDDGGNPTAPGKGNETNCNALVPWLEKHGERFGWIERSEESAALHAANGGPAIAIWRNPSGRPGHVAVLLPSSDSVTRVAQAGARCLFDVPLIEGFGGKVFPLRFFIHP